MLDLCLSVLPFARVVLQPFQRFYEWCLICAYVCILADFVLHPFQRFYELRLICVCACSSHSQVLHFTLSKDLINYAFSELKCAPISTFCILPLPEIFWIVFDLCLCVLPFASFALHLFQRFNKLCLIGASVCSHSQILPCTISRNLMNYAWFVP